MRRLVADWVYPLKDGSPEGIEGGFVDIDESGFVIACGRPEEAPHPEVRAERLRGAIIPSFVNTHCHIELSYMHGLFRKGTGMAGFIDQINALRDTTPLPQRISLVERWMDTMWKRGVGAMADISNCADSFGPKASSPMHTHTFIEVFGAEPSECEDIIRNAEILRDKARSFGLEASVTPHACYTMSPQLLASASVSGLSDGFLSYHCQESPQEDEMISYGTGLMAENRRALGIKMPPVTGGSALGYFIDTVSAVCPEPLDGNLLLVHEVCLDKNGAAQIKKRIRRPFIALCPCSNIFIHNMLPPIPLMRESGIPLTIGTDSLSSNDELDPVSEMRVLLENFQGLGLGELLVWACHNGAGFLRMSDVLGSIEPGKHPGIVHIDNLSPDGSLTAKSKSERLI